MPEDYGDSLIEDLGLEENLTVEIHPEGTELTLRITFMDGNHESKEGNISIAVVFDDPENPDTIDDIFMFFSKPSEGDSVKEAKKKRTRIKSFYNAFGIDTSGQVDTAACIGETGDAILGVKEFEGRRTNEIRRFVG